MKTVAFDLDCCTVDFRRFVKDYFPEWATKNKIKFELVEDGYNFFNCENSRDVMKRFLNEEFHKSMCVKYLFEEMMEIIEDVVRAGNRAIVITARLDEYESVIEDTKRMLEEANLPLDKVIFSREKHKIILEEEVSVIIEDNPFDVDVYKCFCKVILRDYGYNKHLKECSQLLRAKDFAEVRRLLKVEGCL